MKSVFIILLISSLIRSEIIFACCTTGYIQVHPWQTNITANSCFLINFAEAEFKIKSLINEIKFVAVNSKGKQFALRIVEANFAGSSGQLFLAPEKNFRMNDSISIKIIFLNGTALSDMQKRFQDKINSCKWFVKYSIDQQSPSWTNDSISFWTWDSRNSSMPSYGVYFNPKVEDNSILLSGRNDKGYSILPIYYKVKLKNQEFICASDGNDASFQYGCVTDLSFSIGSINTAHILIYDSSGNISQDREWIFFLDSHTDNAIKRNN